VRDVLARPEEDAGSLLGLLVIVTALAMPACGWAMRRFDPWRLMMCAATLYAVLSLCLGVVGPLQNFTVVALLYAALGVPFAGLQLVPFALLAHIAHRESAATGRASEGLFTGVWTAAEKLGLALGPAIGGLGLSLIGFTGGAAVPAGIAEDLRWIPAAGPCLFMLLSLVVLRRAIGARS
jgi:Na+/melibiose symporter-like transporter